MVHDIFTLNFKKTVTRYDLILCRLLYDIFLNVYASFIYEKIIFSLYVFGVPSHDLNGMPM